jgi:LysM repeat protein
MDRMRNVIRILTGMAVPVLTVAVITGGSPGFGAYKVKPGDTLSHIASRYGTTVRTLVALNKLPGNGNALYAGEVLTIPGKGTPTTATRPAKRSLGRVTYVVKSGDTISAIAKRFKCSQANLLAANGLHTRVTGSTPASRRRRGAAEPPDGRREARHRGRGVLPGSGRGEEERHVPGTQSCT